MKLTKNLAIIVSSSWTRYAQSKILVCKDLLAFAHILIGLSSLLSANAVIECWLNDLPGGNFRQMFTRTSNTYNLHSESRSIMPRINKVTKGRNVISYFGLKLWNLIPATIRNNETSAGIIK